MTERTDSQIESKVGDYRSLSPEARLAVDAVIDLAKASFAERDLSAFPEVFGQCIETGECLRELTIARLNEFFREKRLIVRDEQVTQFSECLTALNQVMPLRVICPSCGEPGRFYMKSFGPGQKATMQILHSGEGGQKNHSGVPLHRAGTSGLQFT